MAADYSQQPRLLKPCAGAVILGLFCFLSIYPVYDCGLADGDVAEYLNNPVRILNGQLPYRDFWLLFSPGEVYLPALTYQLFGLSINAVLIQNLAINAMLAAVVFLVSWLLIRSHLAVVPALLVFFGGPPRWTPTFTYPQTYLLLCFVGAMFLVVLWQSQWRGHAFLAGLCFGAGMCWNLNLSVLPLGAATVVLLATPNSSRRASITALLLGAALSPLTVFLLLHQTAPAMVKALTVDTLAHGSSMPLPWYADLLHCFQMAIRAVTRLAHGNPLPILQDGAQCLSVTVSHILPIVLLFTAWPLTRLAPTSRSAAIFFGLWGLAALPKFAVRAGMGNLTVGLAPLFVLLALLLASSRDGSKARRHVLWAAATLLMLAVPVVLAQSVREWLRPHYQVSTAHGCLRPSDPTAAADLKRLLRGVDQRCPASGYLFVTGWSCPPLYALTGRRNPTYYDSMIDLIARPDPQRHASVIRSLQLHPPALIVHDPRLSFDHRPELQFRTACAHLQAFLNSHYHFAVAYGPYQLLTPDYGGNTWITPSTSR